MAKLPLEIINLRENKNADILLAIEEANSVQDDIVFSLLDKGFSDALSLHVLSNTDSGAFFNALAEKKAEWRGFHPYI